MSVVNAFNIFMDTNTEGGFTGTIDKFTVACGRNKITCDDGQSIRVSLQNFNMYRQHYNINEYNKKLKIIYDASWAADVGIAFPPNQNVEIG